MMKTLSFKVTIKAAIGHVWSVIGTEAGIRSYMSPNVFVDPVVGGPYEIYFDMEQGEGLRGSEGMKVMAIEPPVRFAFTWNNPPSLPNIRGQQTAVFYSLFDKGDTTEVTLDHVGFGDSEDWQKSYDYFTRAWGMIVLPRLVHVVENGPIPWGEDLKLTPLMDRIKCLST